MHQPLHTAVLVYLLAVAVPAALLLLLIAGQALIGRLGRRPAHEEHGQGPSSDEVDQALAARRAKTDKSTV